MCAPLCDAVTGDGDGAALLAEAYRSNLFVVALDDRGHWFRYHHLLRDLLQRELARAEPRARRRAARARGRLAQRDGRRRRGDHHAIAAGAVESASELIAAHWQRGVGPQPADRRALARRARRRARSRPTRGWAWSRGWAALFTGRLDEVEPAIAGGRARPAARAAAGRARHVRDEDRRSCAPRSRTCAATSPARTRWPSRRRDGAAPLRTALASMLIGLTATSAATRRRAGAARARPRDAVGRRLRRRRC